MLSFCYERDVIHMIADASNKRNTEAADETGGALQTRSQQQVPEKSHNKIVRTVI